MYPTGFNIVKTVYELLNNLCKYSILERDMMSIFPNCAKKVRVQALSDSIDAENFGLYMYLSELPSRVCMIDIKSLMRGG